MGRHTTKSILNSWRSLLSMGSKSGRLSLIKKIFHNNYEIYELISNQVHLLEKYEDEFKDVMPVDDYIKEYEEMLNLLGLTSNTYNGEWDDETDRKS